VSGAGPADEQLIIDIDSFVGELTGPALEVVRQAGEHRAGGVGAEAPGREVRTSA